MYDSPAIDAGRELFECKHNSEVVDLLRIVIIDAERGDLPANL